MANFSFTGNDGTQIPKMSIMFSNGVAANINLQRKWPHLNVTPICIFEGTVPNEKSSSITVIGCLYEDPKDRPEEITEENHQRTIYLRAEMDSGGYLQYISNTTKEIETVKFQKYVGKFYIYLHCYSFNIDSF